MSKSPPPNVNAVLMFIGILHNAVSRTLTYFGDVYISKITKLVSNRGTGNRLPPSLASLRHGTVNIEMCREVNIIWRKVCIVDYWHNSFFELLLTTLVGIPMRQTLTAPFYVHLSMWMSRVKIDPTPSELRAIQLCHSLSHLEQFSEIRLGGPIRGQYSDHVTCIDQSEASILGNAPRS